jgi:hypothetical protein
VGVHDYDKLDDGLVVKKITIDSQDNIKGTKYV